MYDQRKIEKLSAQKIVLGKLKELPRQSFRKKLHYISRELDNYFCPKYHRRAWFPNGTFIRKHPYYYADPGLGFHYEKNNVEQLKNINQSMNQEDKKKLQNFIEYTFLEDNQFTVTIEYCANCEEHKMHTFHKASLYKDYALSIQKCILLRFPFISVILKPIDTDILKEEKYKLPKVKKNGAAFSETQYVNDKFKDVRIGAFEIQICLKNKSQESQIALIHSKLQTKKFPEISKVLDKIVSFLPKFQGQIITYEKEDYERILDDDINDNQGNLIKSSYLEGLQINIYLLKNNKITTISENAWNEIQSDQDPRKRSQMMKEQKIKEKEQLYKANSIFKRISPYHSFSNNSKRDSIYNKMNKTSLTNLNRSHTLNVSNIKNRSATARNIGSRPATAQSFNSSKTRHLQRTHSSFHRPGQEIITDKAAADSLKGKLIVTKYTNGDGVINIGPLPYDSYFIEVQESKQYMGIGMTLSFNQILPSSEVIKKYIGLYTQENSFLQLHVYETVTDKEGKEDQIHLGNCSVILKKIDDEENFRDKKETKIKIHEKPNVSGLFEHTCIPGKYLLEVQKTGYETIRKNIDLEKGLNNINIEMSIERDTNLKIAVYNYEKFQEEIYVPVANAEISIYQNSTEIVNEGISDAKGEMNYLVTKGLDFLTIVINKLGYYPVQRTLIRNKNAPINQKGEYEEVLIFFLVKESFILENNCIVCVTYSNLHEFNFEPSGILLSEALKNNINLSCYDGQKENGIISTFIKFQGKMTERDEEELAPSDLNYVSSGQGKSNFQAFNQDNMPQENNGDDKTVKKDTNDYSNVIANNQINEPLDDSNENYDTIISLSLNIQTEALRQNNHQDKGILMNGLERFGCLTIIYTPKNVFYLPAPSFCKEDYCIWNLGWMDVKNQLFYESNILTNTLLDRTAYLSEWLDFLQTILDNKIYIKLFEFFGFDRGFLVNGDRFVEPGAMFQGMKKLNIITISEKDQDDVFTYISNFFKTNNKLISFSLLKKKICSNLKNFSDDNVSNMNQENANDLYKDEMISNN